MFYDLGDYKPSFLERMPYFQKSLYQMFHYLHTVSLKLFSNHFIRLHQCLVRIELQVMAAQDLEYPDAVVKWELPLEVKQ